MQPQLASSDDLFASAVAHFSTTCDWLRGDAMGLAHGEIETHVLLASREIARRMLQAHFDLRARQERQAPPPTQVAPDAVPAPNPATSTPWSAECGSRVGLAAPAQADGPAARRRDRSAARGLLLGRAALRLRAARRPLRRSFRGSLLTGLHPLESALSLRRLLATGPRTTLRRSAVTTPYPPLFCGETFARQMGTRCRCRAHRCQAGVLPCRRQ